MFLYRMLIRRMMFTFFLAMDLKASPDTYPEETKNSYRSQFIMLKDYRFQWEFIILLYTTDHS